MTTKSNLRWTPQCLPQSIVPTITVMYAWVCVCVYVCRGGIHRGICCSWFILRKFVRHNLRPTIGVLQKLTKNSHVSLAGIYLHVSKNFIRGSSSLEIKLPARSLAGPQFASSLKHFRPASLLDRTCMRRGHGSEM